MPSVAFASGILTFTEAPISREFFSGPRRYVDSSVKLWGTEAIHAAPATIVAPQAPSTWVDQLMILPSASGYSVIYGKRSNFGVEFGSFTPEVFTGSGFPGFPEATTAILTSRLWLGISSLVLGVPDSFLQARKENASAAAY